MKRFIRNNRRLIQVIFALATLMAIIYYVQFYFHYKELKEPFPWLLVFFGHFGTYYIFGLFALFLIFLSKKYRIDSLRSPKILVHILAAILIALIYLIVAILYNRLIGFSPSDMTLWELYKYDLTHYLHIVIIAYWGIVGATYAFEYLEWYKIAEGERTVLADQLERINTKGYLSKLQVKEKGVLIGVSLDKISWIEAFDNYIKLHSDDRFYLMRKTLSSLERELDPNLFCRIHRSFLVNINMVESLKKLKNGDGVLKLSTDVELRVSRNYRNGLESCFGQ